MLVETKGPGERSSDMIGRDGKYCKSVDSLPQLGAGRSTFFYRANIERSGHRTQATCKGNLKNKQPTKVRTDYDCQMLTLMYF